MNSSHADSQRLIIAPYFLPHLSVNSSNAALAAGVVPNAYVITLEYHDGHGHSWKETSIQDLDLLNDVLFDELYNVHHAAKALREISKLLGKSPHIKGDFAVTTETRERRIERKRAEHQAWKERIAAHEAEQAATKRSDEDAD